MASRRSPDGRHAEDLLIENRRCFQIIHDHQLGDRSATAVVLVGRAALSDQHVEQIRRFVGRGAAIGPVATDDQWMLPRTSRRWTTCRMPL